MKKNFYINEVDNTIVIDRYFFESLYIDKSIILGKELSSLSFRLASVLIQELDDIHPRKLPKRTELAERLNVSRNSIVSSLYQLESAGFIERFIKDEQTQGVEISQYIYFADENRQLEVNEYNSNKKKEKRENRDFSDLFRINSNYNECARKMPQQELLNEILGFSNKNKQNVELARIIEIEQRLEIIEKKLKINKG